MEKSRSAERGNGQTLTVASMQGLAVPDAGEYPSLNPKSAEVLSNASYSQSYASEPAGGIRHHVVISATSSQGDDDDQDETMTQKKRERPATPMQKTKEERKQEEKERAAEEEKQKQKEKDEKEQKEKMR